MSFEKSSGPVSVERQNGDNKPGLLARIFRKKEEGGSRRELLQSDQEKKDAENLLKDLPTTKKSKVREITEKGKEVDPKTIALLLSKVPPEKKAIIDSAKSYLGTKEAASPNKIKEFHTSAGQNGCGPETAWCMSFVQHVLKQTHNPNYKPTAWAKDGLSLGKPTQSPQIGDLLVVERGDGGHIGFFLGFSDTGNPIIIGGNQGSGEVSVKEETRPVLGYRSIA